MLKDRIGNSIIPPTVAAVAALVLACSQTIPAAAAQTPPVAASIGPIHSLVQMVLGDHGEAGLLMEPGESPHGAAFRPSQRRMIDSAALVFIVDPEFERHLAKPLEDHGGMVALARSPGLVLLPSRRELRFEASEDEHDDHGHDGDDHDDGHKDDGHDDHDDHGHDDHDDHGHAHGREDLHVWLDPRNAVLMVRHIETQLAKQVPEHKADFAANARAAEAKLKALDAEISARMEAARHIRFISFHDGYQYFERRYGLTVPATVLDLHGEAVSAARLRDLEEIMRNERVDCIFTEPQFDAKLVAVLQRSSDAKRSGMDPLGSELKPGVEFYPDLIRDIAGAVESCASG